MNKMNKIADIYTINKEREIFLENCKYAEKIHAEQWRLRKVKKVKKGFKIVNPFAFDIFDDEVFEFIFNSLI